MSGPGKSPAPVGAGNPGYYEARPNLHVDNSTPPAIDEAIRKGIGTHRAACPECKKTRRDTALSITVEDDGNAVWYCFRCGYAGTTKRPTIATLKARKHREDAREIWREGLRNALTGAQPKRWPPFTKQLSRRGEVWIVTGAHAWKAAKRLDGRAVCLPPGHLPQAYRWPVAGRVVTVFDTDLCDGSTLGDGSNHAADCPVCHDELVNEWLRAFAWQLIQRWHAIKVSTVSDGRVRHFRAEVCDVA